MKDTILLTNAATATSASAAQGQEPAEPCTNCPYHNQANISIGHEIT